MRRRTRRDLLTVAAAAVTGAVGAAGLWAGRASGPWRRTPAAGSGDEEALDLLIAFGRPAAGRDGADADDVLAQHWSRLHSLDLPPAPTPARTASRLR